MRKRLLIMLLLATAMPLAAQNDQQHRRSDITELVSDLSTAQQRKLDNLRRHAGQQLDTLRAQQRAVRDSINMYMELDGDHSRQLYPLFDREAQLQAAVSRTMYTTKLRVDEVLTDRQREQLRRARQKDAIPPAKHAKPGPLPASR